MEFEQSMRATSMSFFKTAKSTFMSSNDLHSDQLMTDSVTQAWADGRGVGRTEADYEAQSDLAGNADQIIAGGTMSILRRKGKQFKERGRRGGANEHEAHGRGAKYYSELLSSDIQTLLQVFHDEANTGNVSQL